MKTPFRVLVVVILLGLLLATGVSAQSKNQKETICHMPGTPAQKTMEVPTQALAGHLAHGDQLGPCNALGPSTGSGPGDAAGKVTICHKPGTPAQKAMDVPVDALAGHLAHGDQVGPCEGLAPPTGPGPKNKPGKAIICHKPGTPAEKTMTLPLDALADHFGHGDILGPCQDVACTAWASRPVVALAEFPMTAVQSYNRRRPFAY
jgi:hypothetical protein